MQSQWIPSKVAELRISSTDVLFGNIVITTKGFKTSTKLVKFGYFEEWKWHSENRLFIHFVSFDIVINVHECCYRAYS